MPPGDGKRTVRVQHFLHDPPAQAGRGERRGLPLPDTLRFAARVEKGDFLEYAEVHGNRYGTLKADILDLLEQGKTVVMDIDVRGAAQVRACRGGHSSPLLCGCLYLRAARGAEKPPLREADGW